MVGKLAEHTFWDSFPERTESVLREPVVMVSIFQYPLTSGIHRTVFIVITGTFFRFLFSFLFLAHCLEVFFFNFNFGVCVYTCMEVRS